MSRIEAGEEAMSKHRIRITLEGMDVEQGHIPVPVFLGTVERVASMLRRIDMKIAGDNKVSFYLRVVGLSHGSPATVDLEQCLAEKVKEDRRERVAKELIEVMGAIESEEEDSGFDYDLLEKADELTAPVGKQLKTLQVSANGTLYDVDLGFREHLVKKLAPEQTSYGSIRGMLEYINIHGREHVFRIYPDVGPSKVTCMFGDDVLADAKAAIGQFVEARGLIKYKAVARYPHEMRVHGLDILSGGGVERLIEARGMFPDLTGELTTEEYIAHVRSQEEQ